MKSTGYVQLILLSVLISFGCAESNYPDKMSAKERKAYYEEFNNSRTPEEWEEIRKNRKAKQVPSEVEAKASTSPSERNPGSVPFAIKNNSIFPKKLRIEDNELKFNPFETRYVGFYPKTKVFLITGEKSDEFLFEITAADQNKTFKIHP